MSTSTDQPPRIVIEASARGLDLGLREIVAARELLGFLVWRDVKVRYKQTLLGASWAILQPLLTAAVFTLFFGRVAGISSDGVPYPIFSFSGLLVWTFFAQGVSLSSASLVNSAHLLTKVYFPRLVVPLGAVLSGLVDLAVASPILAVMMFYFDVAPGLRLLALPFFVVLALVAATGVGVWLAALNVEYRDVRYVIPFMLQIWLFVTPIIYPSSTIIPRIEGLGLPAWVFGLNPMTGVVEGVRWATLGSTTDPLPLVVASTVSSVLLLVSGTIYFRRLERSFADVV